MKLKNIAQLQSGVYLKVSEDPKAKKAYLLGLRDFDDEFEYMNTSVEVNKGEVNRR